MKKLVVFVAVFVSNISFTQDLIINVNESKTYYSFDSISLNNIFDIDKNTIPEYSTLGLATYKFDLTRNELFFRDRNGNEEEYPIEITKLSETKLQIIILVPDYNISLIVDTDIHNERVVWYNNLDVVSEIAVFTNFEIVKSI